MSAFGGKADIAAANPMSAFDPKRTSAQVKNSNLLCCNGNSPTAGRMV
jgi:hypothetical protein